MFGQLERIPTPFDNLPLEIVLEILSFLTPTDLCHIASVSKRWQQLSEKDSLWKRFLSSEDQNKDFQKKLLYKEFLKLKKKLDSIQQQLYLHPFSLTHDFMQTPHFDSMDLLPNPRDFLEDTLLLVNQTTFFKKGYTPELPQALCKNSNHKFFKDNEQDPDDDLGLKKMDLRN